MLYVNVAHGLENSEAHIRHVAYDVFDTIAKTVEDLVNLRFHTSECVIE